METREATANRITEKAWKMRRHALEMSLRAGSNGAHLGPGFSATDIVATLYFGGILKYDVKNPSWADRDRFILSKGHGVLPYYSALAEAGFFSTELLKTFETKDSHLGGHPKKNPEMGIDSSSGSLGQGLSVGVGLALSAKMNKQSFKTYVLVGDGENNEGQIWEAAMAAVNFNLDNLVAILDYNRFQCDGVSNTIMEQGDLANKWRSFGWAVREVNGHDPAELLDALHSRNIQKGKPYMVFAHTIKGKGVSFFENNNKYHHIKLAKEEYDIAMAEIEAHLR